MTTISLINAVENLSVEDPQERVKKLRDGALFTFRENFARRPRRRAAYKNNKDVLLVLDNPVAPRSRIPPENIIYSSNGEEALIVLFPVVAKKGRGGQHEVSIVYERWLDPVLGGLIQGEFCTRVSCENRSNEEVGTIQNHLERQKAYQFDKTGTQLVDGLKRMFISKFDPANKEEPKLHVPYILRNKLSGDRGELTFVGKVKKNDEDYTNAVENGAVDFTRESGNTPDGFSSLGLSFKQIAFAPFWDLDEKGTIADKEKALKDALIPALRQVAALGCNGALVTFPEFGGDSSGLSSITACSLLTQAVSEKDPDNCEWIKRLDSIRVVGPFENAELPEEEKEE